MVGEPETATRRCEPVFQSFSRHVFHLGGPGSGQTAKLLNNMLMAMNLWGSETRSVALAWAYAARWYSLMRPPRTGRRWIRSRERPATAWSGRAWHPAGGLTTPSLCRPGVDHRFSSSGWQAWTILASPSCHFTWV